MANLERTAMDYALLFALGILGMFVAHFLAFLGAQATGDSLMLPYWWGYPLAFPALASLCFVTFAATAVISFLAARREHLPTATT